MKQLLLIRHGKSSWRDPVLTDLNRPLKNRGESDARDMAKRLGKRAFDAEKVFMSPARRVVDTLKCMAEETGFGEGVEQVLPELYTFSFEDVIHILKDLDASLQSVAVAGHNPAINDLVNFLCLENISNLPTCAVAAIRLDVDSWSDIKAGCGEVVYFDFPKNK